MRFLNMEIDNLSFDEALERIREMAEAGGGGYVVTPNVDHVVRLEQDEKFREAYRGASLVLTDGQPLLWIAKLLGCPIREKISGSDLFPRLCELAAAQNYRMYFLGAAEGVARMAAENLKKRYPGLLVTGTYSPPYGFEKDPAQVSLIWEKIRKARPKFLIVCLGTPKQELFLWENRKELDGILAFGFGASLDFAAGKVQRAPRWMQKCGLEWFYRLCREPRRLFRRYLADGIKILPIVWKYRKG